MLIFSLCFSIYFDKNIYSSPKSLADRYATHHTWGISLELCKLLPPIRNSSLRIDVRNHRRRKYRIL